VLVAGSDGGALREDAEAWLRARGVVRPARLAAALVGADAEEGG